MAFSCSRSKVRLANKETDATSTYGHHHLFREDVVQLESEPGLLGIVDRYSGDPTSSDSECGSPSGADDEEHASQQAAILWLNEDAAASVDVAQLRVVDRWFVHGHVVALESAPSGQLGKVIEVTVTVDVELADGSIRRGLDTKQLHRVRSLATKDFVVQGSWVGEVKAVENNVTVVFEVDGATCKVVEANPDYLIPAGLVDNDTEYPYYPGQRVKATTSKVFKRATWLEGRYKSGRLNATVVAVDNGPVKVHWLVSRNSRAQAPAHAQSPQDLLPLTHFTYTEWLLGDRCYAVLPTKEGNEQSPETHEEEESRLFRASKAGVKTSKIPPKLPKSFVASSARIVNMKTKVDVLWQDSSTSLGIDSCDLIHSRTVLHDFFPAKCVKAKKPPGEELFAESADEDSKLLRTGIVQMVDPQHHTAVVRWMNSWAKHPEKDSEEIVSVGDLIPHPKFSYDLRDAVIRLPKSKPKADGAGREDQQWVGAITGLLLDGGIEVKWLDGSSSTTKPSELVFALHQDSSSSSSTSGSERLSPGSE